MRVKLLVGVYLLAIVAANLLVVAFGPSVTVVNAFLFIGLDLTTRDTLHEHWQGRRLWLNMAALIVAGSAISYLLNRDALPIAVASCVAFGAAALVDTLAYHLLGRYAKLVRVNGSNVLSAAVDSLIFPALAFGLPLLWWIVAGQFVAKVAGGFVWSLILNRRAQAVMA